MVKRKSSKRLSRTVVQARLTHEPCNPQAVLEHVPAAMAFALFNHLPDVYLFVKDTQHRFIAVNTALWQLHGCSSTNDMVGKSDLDFHPPALATQYIAEDRLVLEKGQTLSDRLWLVQGADGVPLWYHSSKIPLRDSQQRIIGLAGVLRPAKAHPADGNVPLNDFSRLAPALNFVTDHYAQPMTISDLAQRVELSSSQLQREFQRLLHLTPSAYIQKVRVLMARHLLERSALAIGTIALDTGFYDQSHFTRIFSSHTGLSPLAYRKRFAAPS